MSIRSLAVFLFMVAAIFAQPVAAQPAGASIPHGVYAEKALEAHVSSPVNFTFNEFEARENLSVTVTNPADARMAVFIAIYRHHEWNVLDGLGDVGPRESKTFTYPVNFTYHGRTTETDEFGIAGKADDTYAGNVFQVGEDWAPYEGRLKSTLSLFGIPLAGLLLGVLAIVMGGVYSAARRERRVRRRAVSLAIGPAELLARLVTSPLFWLSELACGAILVSLILFFALRDITPGIGWLVFLIGGAAAVFMPAVFLVAAWLFKFYRRQPFRLMASMFTWGVMATLIAFLANTACTLLLGAALGKAAAFAVAAVLVAPVVEETSKGTGVLIMSGRQRFGGTLDGILYGFAVGMGFAFIENWLYFAANANPVAAGGIGGWAFDILYRSIICSLAHGCFTGATGGMVGYFKARQLAGGFAFEGFRRGLPMAMALHSTFNVVALLGSAIPSVFGVPLPLFDPLLTLIIAIFYICLGVYLQFKEKLTRSGSG